MAAIDRDIVYSRGDVEEVLVRLSSVASSAGTPPPPDVMTWWHTVAAMAGPDGTQELDPATLEHLKCMYDYVEGVIISCGAPDSFDVYEVCFETVTKVGFFLHCYSSKLLLYSLLEHVHEVYDVLLSCVETYEWVQPGATGLLRLWMLQVIVACFGSQQMTGRCLMELTDNDVSGAVSLISFILQCPQSPFEMQATAGQCLVELTAADSVFLGQMESGNEEDLQNQQIAKLTGMLNRHVNGLIKGLIQFDVVESFGRCICKHQMSHTRTDIVVKAFLTTIHNCLLYCSENQTKLRQHLATQSTIVQDIMIPYVDNILPALYDMPHCGPSAIEWQNLKATMQTFVVVTFNIKVFRSQLNKDSDILVRICRVPNILNHINTLELLIKLCINVDFSKGPYCDALLYTLQGAYERLPVESKQRLQRRMTTNQSMRLPYARSCLKAVELFEFVLAPPEGEAPPMPAPIAAAKPADKKKQSAFAMQSVARAEDAAHAPATSPEEESDDDMPPLIPAEDWVGHLGAADAAGVPTGALCSLSGTVMHDPVATSDGHMFDRAALEDWTDQHASHPFTGQPMTMADVSEATPEAKAVIQGYQIQSLSAQQVSTEAKAALAAAAPPWAPSEPSAAPPKAAPATGPSLLGELPTLGGSAPEAPKKIKKKGTIRIESRSVIDCPDYMCCAVDGKVMVNPIKSPYGHLFEKKTLERWIANCGSVCPISAKPLRLEECVPDAEMKKKIVQFLKGQQ